MPYIKAMPVSEGVFFCTYASEKRSGCGTHLKQKWGVKSYLSQASTNKQKAFK